MKNSLKTAVFLLMFVLLPALGAFAADYIAEGNKSLNEKKYDEAVGFYLKAIEANPKDTKAMGLLGLTYAKTGDFENAVRYTKQAALIDPGSYTAYYNLGLIYGASNKPQESIQAFDRAIEINPDSFMPAYQKGLLLSSLGDYTKAISSFRRALQANPELDQARIALVGTYMKTNDRASAEAQIGEFRKMKKDAIANILEKRLRNP